MEKPKRIRKLLSRVKLNRVRSVRSKAGFFIKIHKTFLIGVIKLGSKKRLPEPCEYHFGKFFSDRLKPICPFFDMRHKAIKIGVAGQGNKRLRVDFLSIFALKKILKKSIVADFIPLK